MDVDIRGIESQTPLHLASKRGYHDTMRLLPNGGADVDAQVDNNSSPLHLASSQLNVEAAKFLVDCGANVKVRNNKGKTPLVLHHASKGGCQNMMQFLRGRLRM